MVSFEVLPNHEGLRLLAHADTLRDMHSIIHDVNERSPLIVDKEGFFLSLAYDVRKAYEGQRRQRAADTYDPAAGVLYGVDILWPTLLVQCRLFRAALGFIDSGKRHQVYAYALEAVVEDGLKADFGSLNDFIYEKYQTLAVDVPVVQDKISSRIELYYGWKKAERRRRLGNLLESLDPSYSFIYKMRAQSGETDLLTPATLRQAENAERER